MDLFLCIALAFLALAPLPPRARIGGGEHQERENLFDKIRIRFNQSQFVTFCFPSQLITHP